MQPSELAKLDTFIKRQGDEKPSHPDAIRQLVDRALAMEPPEATFEVVESRHRCGPGEAAAVDAEGQIERAAARKAIEMPEAKATKHAGAVTAAVEGKAASLARSDAAQIDRLENEGGETDPSTERSRRKMKGAARATELAVAVVKDKLAKVDAPDEEKIARKRKLVAPPETAKIRKPK